MSLTQRLFSEAFRDMQRAMSVFDQPLINTVAPALGSRTGAINNLLRYPATDLVETPQGYELHAELPGYDKNNIKIEMPDSQTLILSGSVKEQYESRSPPSDAAATAEEGTTAGEEGAKSSTTTDETQVVAKDDKESQVSQYKPQYWVNERVSGSFQRAFQFPTPVKSDDIKASFENGVLKVLVPKSAENQPKQISIE